MKEAEVEREWSLATTIKDAKTKERKTDGRRDEHRDIRNIHSCQLYPLFLFCLQKLLLPSYIVTMGDSWNDSINTECTSNYV